MLVISRLTVLSVSRLFLYTLKGRVLSIDVGDPLRLLLLLDCVLLLDGLISECVALRVQRYLCC